MRPLTAPKSLASTIQRVTLVQRVLKAAAAALAFALYVWFRAVRLTPSVKRRKAARRARRRSLTGS
jgi:hypothetical protein